MPGVRTSPVVLLLQNPADRAMYAEFLRHHGVEALCPSDATEAAALAPQTQVIVTELMVPTVSDGVEFIRRLRADGRTKHLPILVVTSWAWQTERLRAEEAGCDVFLTKPCLPDELLREIRNVFPAVTLQKVRGTPAKSAGTRSNRSRHTG
jgi:CheY-like chemotaxis protein